MRYPEGVTDRLADPSRRKRSPLGGRAYAKGVSDLSPGLRLCRYPGLYKVKMGFTPKGLLTGRSLRTTVGRVHQSGFLILENFEPVDAAEMSSVTGHQWQSPVNCGRGDENVIISETNVVVPEYTRYLAGIPANFPIQRDYRVWAQSLSAVFLLFFRKALSKLSHRNYTDIERYVRMIQQESRGTSSLSLSCLAFQVNEKCRIEKHQSLFLSL